MKLKIIFFGNLTEITKTNQIEIDYITSLSKLKNYLFNNYPKLTENNFRISVNCKIINNDINLNCGDEIALLPPFAGG